MKNTLIIFFLSCSFLLQGQDDESKIRAVMSMQEDCWNAGDIECFMQGYWNSKELSFTNKEKVIYGWNTTYERYLKNYPDMATMGQLKFGIKLLQPLGKDHYHMIGTWNLKREMGDIGGHFTLVWRRVDNKWVIISDHTS